MVFALYNQHAHRNYAAMRIKTHLDNCHLWSDLSKTATRACHSEAEVGLYVSLQRDWMWYQLTSTAWSALSTSASGWWEYSWTKDCPTRSWSWPTTGSGEMSKAWLYILRKGLLGVNSVKDRNLGSKKIHNFIKFNPGFGIQGGYEIFFLLVGYFKNYIDRTCRGINDKTTKFVCCCLLCLFCFYLPG